MKFLHEKTPGVYQRRLVVLDLNMRVKDGRTTLREIRANPDFTSIPVVVLSTSDNDEDVEYCKRYGADYFRKPSSIVGL